MFLYARKRFLFHYPCLKHTLHQPRVLLVVVILKLILHPVKQMLHSLRNHILILE